MKCPVRTKIKMELPASHKIETCYLLDQRKPIFDHKIIFEHFLNEGRLTKPQIKTVITESTKILEKEPNLLRINTSSFIIGDINGQLYDLKSTIEKFDLNKDVLVFLGDYVDRGAFSLEVYVYLLALKIEFPTSVFLLRGNHESLSMTSYFTFMNEVVSKYDTELFYEFVDSFRVLPIAAVIMGKAFCCHGGISPSLNKLDDINKINRFTEIPKKGLFCDLMWADPHPKYGDRDVGLFTANYNRNCSYFFSFEAVKNFLRVNGLDTIFRGHEVQKTGFRKYREYKPDIPSVLTIFSAPNYCDVYGNQGALAYYDGIQIKIIKFNATKHPHCNKNFANIINQTLPFVCEKISEFYLDILKFLSFSDTSSSTITDPKMIGVEVEETAQFAANMAVMRVERENADEVDDKDPSILNAANCVAGETVIKTSYDKAHELDSKNEVVVPLKGIADGISVQLSPSLLPEKSKEWAQKGVENVRNNLSIDASEKLIKIEEVSRDLEGKQNSKL